MDMGTDGRIWIMDICAALIICRIGFDGASAVWIWRGFLLDMDLDMDVDMDICVAAHLSHRYIPVSILLLRYICGGGYAIGRRPGTGTAIWIMDYGLLIAQLSQLALAF
jgi:hypothetical protein